MNITPDQLKILEEVANQAAHRGSESLSKLIGVPVELEMLRTRVVEVDQLAAILASPETRVSAVVLPINGEEGGSSALIATLGESRRLVELVTKQPLPAQAGVAEQVELDAHAVSVLKETGNIIGGAFLSALSDTVGISLVQSVPELVTDTMAGVVSAVVARLPSVDKAQSVAFEIDFSLSATTTTTETIVAHYLFLLEVAFAQKLLEALQGSLKKISA